MDLPTLPKPLTLEEKKYLLAVERGDMSNVRRSVAPTQQPTAKKHIEVNCVDSLGRGALTLAIDGENMEMVELLVIMGVETKDALLQAINAEFVEAKVDPNTAMFTPDITPLMLAAHKNNYEIIKILLDRGAAVPNPHDVRYHAPDVGSTQEQLRDYQDIARSRSGRPKPSRCQVRNNAMFTPDITPLMLAAHKNNYEIIKILLDRGAAVPNPHDVR
ncbi:Calmodulin-binding protein trpl [Operophtera brumata]|uniref:Calmodulin-binding protein trpl n=1 Tax=Operophtera brumata TaxID=104452 RepID=A0A0L7KQ29_OPEBR|nr:Calmodulin-binding protein trpl [Operophtera brumata]